MVGGLSGELILNEKGWFGSQTKKVLHAGEGPIQTIKWRGNFIAWANDLGVKLFDTTTQQRISYIERPKNSPRPDMFVVPSLSTFLYQGAFIHFCLRHRLLALLVSRCHFDSHQSGATGNSVDPCFVRRINAGE